MNDSVDAFDIAASGMAAQRVQMDLIAENLAHANVSRADGAPFVPRVAQFEPTTSFAEALDAAAGDDLSVSFDDESQPAGVRFAGFAEQPRPGVEQPSSGVDPISQMIGLITAGRAYDADVSALQAAKQMELDAVDVGRL